MESACKIVIFSDLHYAPEIPVNNGSEIGRKLIEKSLPIFESLVYKIKNEIKPDIVFNLGDVIEDFNDKEKDKQNYRFILNKLKQLNCPFYSATGNHDLRSMDSREELEELMGYEHSTFSLDFNGYHFIVLGLELNNNQSNVFGGILKAHRVSEEDLIWLENDLKHNKLPCIVFSHYSVASDDMKGNYWFGRGNAERGVLGNSKEVKNILKKDKNLIAVFSGHQHWTKFHIEDGVSYYVIGSLSENINNNGIPDGVYFEVDLKDKNITIAEKRITI